MVSTRSSSTRGLASAPATPAPASSKTRSARASLSGWSHTPTTPTLAWLAIAMPLVAWDTGYVLLRPLTMEGGSLHWPLYVPYRLYGEIDHVYGWKAYNSGNGFTGAQAFLNVIEWLMYAVYLVAYFRNGVALSGEGARKSLVGRDGAFALLVAFSAAVMTLSKTVLYWMCEYYGNFDNIGHNTPFDLIFLWIIPNGAWLVGSSYMIWSMGGDILDGLATAAGESVKTE